MDRSCRRGKVITQRASGTGVVDLPPEKKAINCRWIFKAKLEDEGRVQIHNARLVARGFAQGYGEDYAEIYALVSLLGRLAIAPIVKDGKQ